MTDWLSFLGFGGGPGDILSLKLEAPTLDAIQNPGKLNNPLQKEIERRVKQMRKAGKGPERIFVLCDPDTRGYIGWLQDEPARKSILLFSSAQLASFFLEPRRVPGHVVVYSKDELAGQASEWQGLGFDSFIFDASPMAPAYSILDLNDNAIQLEQLTSLWLLQRAVRDLKAQNLLVKFYGNGSVVTPGTLQKQRAALEKLRNWGSYDVPFVHWMIALLAAMQDDEEARQASTEALERFGPDFVGRTVRPTCREELDAWARSMELAVVGLLAEYGILYGKDGKPVESRLRVETARFGEGLPPC